MNVLLLAALCGWNPTPLSDDDLTVLPITKTAPPDRMVRTYLLSEANKAFKARREAVASLKSPEDVEQRRRDLRAKLIEALGGFPERTPLNPRTVGKADSDGYRIEKLIYESRPDHHVTATLYLPVGNGPVPGVLMPIGHSDNGKAAEYVQRGAILLAKNGIACLAYDPIGQGERKQLLNADGKAAIRGSTTEHSLIGIGALLVGESAATYRIWDGMRSLDYLAGRPEIDPNRLGCSGCSGGGTLTSYLMALDDRIAVAAPSCYLTTLERLFHTIGPQDAEQNITGQVALGIDHADYILLRAPKPTLMLVASRDFFDIDGAWATFREAKRIYGLLGLSERIELMESDTPHGYPRQHREPMLRWMSRWLLDHDQPLTEPEFPIASDAELLCTRTGQVLSALEGVSCFDLNRARAERLAAERSRTPRTRDALRDEVRRRLALPEAIPTAKPTAVGAIERDGYRIHKVIYTTEPGIQIPGLRFEPDHSRDDPLVVLVSDEGKAQQARAGGPIEELVRAGRRVLAVDLRGWGETTPAQARSESPLGRDSFEAMVALHLNRPLLGQRVFDLLAILDQCASQQSQGFELIGAGNGGLVVLHAAALCPVKGVRIERSVPSWTSVASTPLTNDQFTSVVPGVLRAYDLPELARLIAPTPLTIVQPVDPQGEPLPRTEARDAWKAAQDAYQAAKAADRFLLESNP
jgi:cephalosporin-C deacetylase-like acetyl esterase/pimeloyl-ACP methyl ester carboxylesterase